MARFPRKYLAMSERLIEVPELMRFIMEHKEIRTALDVGCYGSSYAQELSMLLKSRGGYLDGIDISAPPPGGHILRNWFRGNIKKANLNKYDLVICLSSLEYAGIKQYHVQDWEKEQEEVFKAMYQRARRYLWISVPYGQWSIHEGQFANMTSERRHKIKLGFAIKHQMRTYFYNETPETNDWKMVGSLFSDQVLYDPTKGVRCVLIWWIEKDMQE